MLIATAIDVQLHACLFVILQDRLAETYPIQCLWVACLSRMQRIWVLPADMGTTHFFIRFNSASESFDSTQLMTHNGFTRNYSSQLTTQN